MSLTKRGVFTEISPSFSQAFLFVGALVAHSMFSYYFIATYSLHRFANLYDAGIFIGVAKNWYSAQSLQNFAMFPLFPAVIRGLASFVGYDLSAVIIVILASSLSTIIFYRIAQIKSNFPFLISIFFIFSAYPWFIVSSLPYSEPLFTLLALSTYYFAEKRRYFLSGITASGAALTRLPGILLIVFLLYVVLREKKLRNLIWIALPAISLGALFTYYYFLTGDFFVTFHVESTWANNLQESGTYLVYPFSFVIYFIEKGPLLANYWRIVLLFGVFTYALYRLRKDMSVVMFSLPIYLLVVSLSPFPTFWFGLDRQLVPVFSTSFFAYENYICRKALWSRLLYLTLIAVFVIFSYRIVDRWCLLAPVVP